MNFLDSSVLAVASTPRDPRHERCVRTLQIADKNGGACAMQSLAEVFAALSGRPVPHKVPPLIASQIVAAISKRFVVVTLTPAEYLSTIADAARLGQSGGIMYDALLVACARKAKASRIYTLNTKHFRLFGSDLRGIIREP